MTGQISESFDHNFVIGLHKIEMACVACTRKKILQEKIDKNTKLTNLHENCWQNSFRR